MSKKDSNGFTNPEDHFALILDGLKPETRAFYDQCRHTRVETGFKNRQFIVYTHDDDVNVIDVLTIDQFEVTFEDGAWTTLRSHAHRSSQMIDYIPAKAFGHPFLLYLPLHSRVRWDVRGESGAETGALAFPIVVRTQSRLHLREPGVTYVETASAFKKEFGHVKLMA